MKNICTKFKALIGLSLLTVVLGTGCKPLPPEKVLSNAQIITAKDECTKGGMEFIVLYYNGNYSFPDKVVCTKPE